jgi:hypothetical protein
VSSLEPAYFELRQRVAQLLLAFPSPFAAPADYRGPQPSKQMGDDQELLVAFAAPVDHHGPQPSEQMEESQELLVERLD